MMRLNLSVRVAGLAMATVALSLGGCKNDDNRDTHRSTMSGTKIRTVNTICPVEGGDFEQGSRTAAESRTWKGKTVGFCCEDCGVKFDAMSAAEKDKTMSMAQSNSKPVGGHHP